MAWLLQPAGKKLSKPLPRFIRLLSALIAAELNCEAHGKEVDFTGSEEVGEDGEPKEGAGGAYGAVTYSARRQAEGRWSGGTGGR